MISTDIFTTTQYKEGTLKYHKIPSYISEDLCYIIGLLLGDGSYSKENYKIEYGSINPELTKKFEDIIGREFDVQINTVVKKNIKCSYLCSKMIINFFELFGLECEGGNDKKIPWCVLEGTKECQIQCIRGMFDTDGGGVSDVIYFTNVSESIIDYLHIMLLNLGIISSKRVIREETGKCNKAFRINICGINARKYMDIIGFGCIHKRKKGIEMSENIPKSNLCTIPDTKIHEWVENGIFFDRVESIDERMCQMYDIGVPEDHTFIANGIVNHNCQGCSLDFAILDLGPKVFSPGMAYVALSRVRTLDGILICSLDPKSLVADPDSLEYEREIIELEKEQDLEYEREKQNIPDEGRYVLKQTFIPNRGVMKGKKITIDKIPGVNRHLIAFIMTDCPEIYEIMDQSMWKLLKNIDNDLDVDNNTLYNRILEVLELENVDEPGSSTSSSC